MTTHFSRSHAWLRRTFGALSTSEFVTFVFLLFLSILNVIFHDRVLVWKTLFALNVSIMAGILVLSHYALVSHSKWLRMAHNWYPIAMLLFVFKETYYMVHPIHPVDYDAWFIAADYWIFGVHPTRWLAAYAHPALTELLQLCYNSYYVLLLLPIIELYQRTNRAQFFTAGFLMIYGFYLSYVGYILLPGVGPRFTLHEFGMMNLDLPGLWLTSALRDFVNTGESIPKAVANAVDYAQRDVFPSGHVQLTLVALYLAFADRLRTRWLMLPVGTLLIVSTVYLRYHYVIDVIAGSVFFVFTIWSGWIIDRWWNRIEGDVKE
ncbi:MAG TPA: phosphatase PAP2 family protein [Bacteroidota bacterium]|nr:phosphatase PAP2 family protein [Bacteroidota bacterium]